MATRPNHNRVRDQLRARLLDDTYLLIVLDDRLLIGFFLSNLDVTIVSSSLTSITDDLDGFDKRSWVITGYLATYTGKI